MFKCPYCDRKYASLSSLRMHVRREHMYKMPCPYCTRRRPYITEVRRRHHKRAYLISSVHARKIIDHNYLIEHLLMYYLCVKKPYEYDERVKLLKDLGYKLSLILLEGG